MRTRVKICGITRGEDGLAAVAAGADAIGLVFYDKSPRYVEVDRAREIVAALPPFISIVALFVNPEVDQVRTVLAALPIGLLQFHGDETAAFCESFSRPYIKAIAMQPGVDASVAMAGYPGASGYLLDAWQPESRGGGGVKFDWADVPAANSRPLILAGGLNPDNVAQAIRKIAPYAVDVSSGVESDKGIKSAQKIEAFMRGVERGDASQTSE